LLALAVAGLADRADDVVALAQAVLAHLGQGDVDVAGPGQVARGADERVVVQDVEDARDRQQDVVLADHRLRLLAAPSAAPVPAVPAAAPAASAELVVVGAARAAASLLAAALAALLGTSGALVVAAAVAVAAVALALTSLPGPAFAV